MRIKVNAEVVKNDIVPWNYQYPMMQIMYELIEDDKLRQRIHNPEYKYNGRIYKPINFSKLLGKIESTDSRGIKFRNNRVSFFISSVEEDVSYAIVNGILSSLSKGKTFKLGNVLIALRSLELVEDIQIPDQNLVIIKTLSPIALHKYDVEKNRKSSVDPYSKEYSKYLTLNIIRKTKAVFGIDYNPNEVYLEVKPFSHKSVRSKLIDIKGDKIRAYEGSFLCYVTSKKSKDLLKNGYLLGVGEKNGIGFGMIDILPFYGYWSKL